MSWIQLDATVSGNEPSRRHCHSCVSHQELIYIFGGTDGKDKFNDVHVFDTVKKEWTQLKTTGDKPTPRYCAAVVLYKHYLVVFGGFDGQRTNTLYSLNLKTLEWENITTTGNIPSPRSHHSLFIYRDFIYLFGGLTDEGKLSNDLHRLNFEKGEWKIINTIGTPPSGRVHHATSLISHFLFVFGGYGGKVRLNDMYLLDLDTFSWSEPLVHGSIPSKRLGQACATVGNKIILFGGDDGNKNRVHLNDLHIFDLSTMMWSQHDAEGDMPPGRHHATLTLVGKHTLYLFGGSGGSRAKYNCLFELNLENVDIFQLYWFDVTAERIYKEAMTFLRKVNECSTKYEKKLTSSSDNELTDNEYEKKPRRRNYEIIKEEKRNSEFAKEDKKGIESKEDRKAIDVKKPNSDDSKIYSDSKDEKRSTSPPPIVGFVDFNQNTKKKRRKHGSRDNNKVKLDIDYMISRSRSVSPPSSTITSPRSDDNDMDINKIIFDDSEYIEESTYSSTISQRIRKMIEIVRSNFNRIIEEKESFKEWKMTETSICEENKKIETLQGEVINKIINQQKSHVLLNVGGSIFETSLDILTSEKNSMLEAMFSGRYTMAKDEDGFYFIDRDGTHFKHILNYLRYKESVILKPQESFLRELYHEALFYQLEGLMDLITKKLSSLDFQKETVVEF